MIKILPSSGFDFKNIEQNRKNSSSVEIEEKVKAIIERVKIEGDSAVLDFTKRFDKIELKQEELMVSQSEIELAWKNADKKFVSALMEAKKNIEFFCKKQLQKNWIVKTKNGFIGETVKPIEKVGAYVPAGKFPLPSSVLMNVLPAKIAGCKEIIICSPPKNGQIDESILIAAKLCGVKKIFKVGGAQAIAAMAYGTETIPKVDKIVGPGNIFVSIAKKQVYGIVGIDFFAGPSEAVIIAEKGNAKFLAADLLAQSEHDENSQSILIVITEKLAKEVEIELEKQLNELPEISKKIAAKSLEKNGLILIAKNLNEAIQLSNEIAPEHLQIYSNDLKLLKKIDNSGSIFLGEFTPIPLGDYASGTNHVLPTNGFARVRGGLSVKDFQKVFAIQGTTKNGLKRIGKTVEKIAEIEGLIAHKNTVKKRLE